MAFTTKEWQNGSEGGTALDADALVDMETRLAEYADSVGGGGGGGGGARAYIDAVQRVQDLALYLPLQVNATAEVGGNGTFVNGAAIATDASMPPGLGGKCAVFDGLNDMLTAPLDLGTNAVTVFCWVKIPESADTDNILVELGSTHAGEDNSFFVDIVAAGTFYLYAKGTSTFTPANNEPADKRLHDNRWHSLSIAFDRGFTNGGARTELAMDGREIFGQSTGSIGAANYPSGTLNLMAQPGNASNVLGSLAHVAVFSRRLSAFEVRYLSEAALYAP
jgi:hypothetical protein